jgi:hypothetical protein
VGALKDLELLVRSRYPVIAVDTPEEDRLERALEQVAENLRSPLFVWSVTVGLRRASTPNVIYDTKAIGQALANIGEMNGDAIVYFKDLLRYLGQPEVVRKILDLAPRFSAERRTMVLTATSAELPRELQKVAATFTLELPSAAELRRLAERVLADLSRRNTITMEMAPADFERLVERLKGFTLFEAERALTQAILRDLALTPADLDFIVGIKKELLGKDGVLEYTAPEENLAAIGGFRRLKAWLAKRQKAFTPEAQQFGLQPPKGLLLLGVMGCGKSLAARAIAQEWGLPLLRLEMGRLYDKFVGESEKNLERALAAAEHMAPCVLMVDEIEKALAHRGGDADAGLSRRILGRILGWLQDRTKPVFVVATCNDVSALPPELMRKGRFDEIFFIDLPTPDERKEIAALHLHKRKRDPARFDLDAVARAAEGFSGAEIEQAVVSALYTAFSHGGDLSTKLLLDELAATRPLSVTRREEIDALRAWARDRTVPAS